MSLKSWFGFPVTPENLTPTPELICICFTAVSVTVLFVVIVTYKCKQKKNRGGKKEDKTAERNSTKALSSQETENKIKHSKVLKAEDQMDGGPKKQEVQKEVKEEVKTETVKKTPVSETEIKDINAEVQQLQSENQGNENLETLNKDLKPDNTELELSKSDEQLKKMRLEPEIQNAEISTLKLAKSEWLRYDMLKEMKKTSSQLKLALAVTRMMKLEDKVNDQDNLKRKLQDKEKELEKFEWLRNELIHGMRESLSQLKLALAITRIRKLEDKLDELLHGNNQTVEKDLQILKTKLEAKEKELKDKEAAVLKLHFEEQNMEDDEKKLQTLKNNSPNSVVNEEIAKVQQQLQDEQRRREDAELTVQKGLESTNKFEDRVAKLKRQLQDEQRRRKNAEKNLQDLKNEVVIKNRKSSLSSGLEDLLKDIEMIDAERVMRENDLQMLKKELETINKGLRQPSADHETMSQTIDELKQTQTQLEEKNAEIRKLRKELDYKLNEEKQRNEKNLESLKKTFETQNKKSEDKVTEVQQQLKDEQLMREYLMERNQELKRQLSELKERYKEELEMKIQVEQQLKKEAEEEVEVLKQELENKRKLKATKEEGKEVMKESDISGDEPSVPTEPNETQDTV